jgi:hypothetical protein
MAFRLTTEFKFEVQRPAQGLGTQHRQPTPNNALQRTALKRMLFAYAKTSPFSSAAELLR